MSSPDMPNLPSPDWFPSVDGSHGRPPSDDEMFGSVDRFDPSPEPAITPPAPIPSPAPAPTPYHAPAPVPAHAPSPAPANLAPAVPAPSAAPRRAGLGRRILGSLKIASPEFREAGNELVDEVKIAAAGVHRTYRATHAARHERSARKKTEANESMGDLLSGKSVGGTDKAYLQEVVGLPSKEAAKVVKMNKRDAKARDQTTIRRNPNKKGAAFVPRANDAGEVPGVLLSYLNPARHLRAAQQRGVRKGMIEPLFEQESNDPSIGTELAKFRKQARIHYNKTGELIPRVSKHNERIDDITGKPMAGYATTTEAELAVFGSHRHPQSMDMHKKERIVRKALRHQEKRRGQVPEYVGGVPTGTMRTGTDAEIYLHNTRERNERDIDKAERRARNHRTEIDYSRDADDRRIQRLRDRRTPITPRPMGRGRVRDFINERHNNPVRRFDHYYYGDRTNPRP